MLLTSPYRRMHRTILSRQLHYDHGYWLAEASLMMHCPLHSCEHAMASLGTAKLGRQGLRIMQMAKGLRAGQSQDLPPWLGL